MNDDKIMAVSLHEGRFEVVLNPGWQFQGDHGYHKHLNYFDDLEEGRTEARKAAPCDCHVCGFYSKPADKR